MALIASTGSENHLRKLADAGRNLRDLAESKQSFPDETAAYTKLGLRFIEPELREGRDEVELAARGSLPVLVRAADIRGELHAHSTGSVCDFV